MLSKLPAKPQLLSVLVWEIQNLLGTPLHDPAVVVLLRQLVVQLNQLDVFPLIQVVVDQMVIPVDLDAAVNTVGAVLQASIVEQVANLLSAPVQALEEVPLLPLLPPVVAETSLPTVYAAALQALSVLLEAVVVSMVIVELVRNTVAKLSDTRSMIKHVTYPISNYFRVIFLIVL